MSSEQKTKEDDKVKSQEFDRMDEEMTLSNESEKLKEYAEAVVEELSRKKIEISEVRKKNEKIEIRRNKKKSKECQEDYEKIKKDDELRKHNEKDDLTNKRRNLKHSAQSWKRWKEREKTESWVCESWVNYWDWFANSVLFHFFIDVWIKRGSSDWSWYAIIIIIIKSVK